MTELKHPEEAERARLKVPVLKLIGYGKIKSFEGLLPIVMRIVDLNKGAEMDRLRDNVMVTKSCDI